MKDKKDNALTDSELMVLGLVAEMPRHGYELEQVIEQRGLREWTPIGFSSIYFVLSKLEKKNFIKADIPESAKAKKKVKITRSGRSALVKHTISSLKTVKPNYSPLLMGMIHWPALSRTQALKALNERFESVTQELERMKDRHFQQQPLPDFADSMFEFSIGQLKAEIQWIETTLEYMQHKVWD